MDSSRWRAFADGQFGKQDMVAVKHSQRGFTLVELLLSMAVFSFVLGICLAVFIQVNRLYYRGISITRTQTAARDIITELTNGIRQSPVTLPSTALADVQIGTNLYRQGYFCVGDQVYYYKLGLRAQDSTPGPSNLTGRRILTRWYQPGYCTAGGTFTIGTNAVELVEDNVSVRHFYVDSTRAEITLTFGNPTELIPLVDNTNKGDTPGVSCRGGRDVAFCGVASISTDIVTRTR